jgi:CheY-like chemotaxis protein
MELLVNSKVLFAGKTLDAVDAVRPELLRRECEIITATSVSLAFYLANKNHPNLIVCNSEMSDGDGAELNEHLKSDPQLKDIPFVMLSEPVEPAKLLEQINGYLPILLSVLLLFGSQIARI